MWTVGCKAFTPPPFRWGEGGEMNVYTKIIFLINLVIVITDSTKHVKASVWGS